ncbi:MAG: acyl-CoA dehydrogenase family protein [Dehalococcoidia bacterium]
MDFSFSEQQDLVRKTARDLFQRECPTDLVREMEGDDGGYSPDLWKKIAELGWLGLPFDQEYGGARAVLEMVVEYAKGRVQFQRPIGTFQAVQHHAANMYADVETMRLITFELAWLVSEGRPCAEQFAMAKAWVSSAYTRMTRTGIQIYGGIGLAKETDPQLDFRRAKAWEPLFGGPDQHRADLAQAIGAETG